MASFRKLPFFLTIVLFLSTIYNYKIYNYLYYVHIYNYLKNKISFKLLISFNVFTANFFYKRSKRGTFLKTLKRNSIFFCIIYNKMLIEIKKFYTLSD